MDLTASHERVFPERLRKRYNFYETRNASAVLEASNPDEFADLVTALDGFVLTTDYLIIAGGNESKLAADLNDRFRSRGWREAAIDTHFRLDLRTLPYKPAGETRQSIITTEVSSPGYLVDNFKGRIALDVEWNAKDGNLDRDLAGYRACYDAAVIDVAIMITREQIGLRELGRRLKLESGASPEDAKKILNTTTTTNMSKLKPRMERGDAAGCPFLAVAISEQTWVGTLDDS